MRCENILPHEKNNMPHRYIKKILSANVYDVAVETPVSAARSLSKRMDNNILFKREDLQPIYSFKIRFTNLYKPAKRWTSSKLASHHSKLGCFVSRHTDKIDNKSLGSSCPDTFEIASLL